MKKWLAYFGTEVPETYCWIEPLTRIRRLTFLGFLGQRRRSQRWWRRKGGKWWTVSDVSYVHKENSCEYQCEKLNLWQLRIREQTGKKSKAAKLHLITKKYSVKSILNCRWKTAQKIAGRFWCRLLFYQRSSLTLLCNPRRYLFHPKPKGGYTWYGVWGLWICLLTTLFYRPINLWRPVIRTIFSWWNEQQLFHDGFRYKNIKTSWLNLL